MVEDLPQGYLTQHHEAHRIRRTYTAPERRFGDAVMEVQALPQRSGPSENVT